MEEEKIRSAFEDYDPELSSDRKFMERLEWKLEAVEHIRHQLVARRRQQRIAVTVAALAGFFLGIVSTLCYPFLAGWLHDIAVYCPAFLSNLPSSFSDTLAWLLLCLATCASAYAVYDITISGMSASVQKLNPFPSENIR